MPKWSYLDAMAVAAAPAVKTVNATLIPAANSRDKAVQPGKKMTDG